VVPPPAVKATPSWSTYGPGTVPGGEGANIAMLDGAELGEAIAAHPGDVEAAFAAYEEVMFARSEAEAVGAHETIDLIFGDGAPNGLVNLFNRAGQNAN
jgi:2-polyprenyl-6-methoxyphenol hydroxylase-like FAD-dependent oxidoreductase